jgi:hypothetical protein
VSSSRVAAGDVCVFSTGSISCCRWPVSGCVCFFRRLQATRRGRFGGASSSRRWASRACALLRFLRTADVECCDNLHRRTHGGVVCGMGTPVLHIVFRLSCSELCVFQLRALRLRADVDWGGAFGLCLREATGNTTCHWVVRFIRTGMRGGFQVDHSS